MPFKSILALIVIIGGSIITFMVLRKLMKQGEMMEKKIKLKVTFDCKLAENIVGTFKVRNVGHDDDELMRYRVPIKILLKDYGYSKVNIKKIERVEN